ncbi:hypothetical protein AMS68_007859 [Peltaster fructicola]|uniref:Matrin-type domain-containing protein n=1 Tax=Peltaster fructicola TaxID=286661 RepID=A0A6H0Y5M6_9PEZI|nr:hypothetical protein AMS68_007859 [Peltaster fructicola]
MAEYWKSTPKYWCKFCEVYIRDTGIERKNHESSAKHQGNIQRSLNKLHKDQAHQQRDAQKAKDEVARLNGLVGVKTSKAPVLAKAQPPAAASSTPRPRVDLGQVDYAAHRRAQAMQLLAMGMELPEALKDAITGSGSWQTVSRTIVEDAQNPDNALSIDMNDPEMRVKGVHKRKAEDEEDEAIAAGAHKRKAWGSSFKTYPGQTAVQDDAEDLDALLNGVVSKKQTIAVVSEPTDPEIEPTTVKQEQAGDAPAAPELEVKQEVNEAAVTAPPVVTFKKRKGKK